VEELKINLKEILRHRLNSEEIKSLNKSYDIIGDIAVIRMPKILNDKSDLIAETILETQNHIKTVLNQSGPVSENYRIRKLDWIAGEKKTETIHKEFGCLFKVDLAKCYFSPRLSYERMRIAGQVSPGEVMVNMFAGVGCYSILISKHTKVKKVFSIDINPSAIHYMRENVLINKVHKKVIVELGDAKNIIQQSIVNQTDRVIMPLPEKAIEYLSEALLALKSRGGWIHFYAFEHGRNNEEIIDKVENKARKKIESLGEEIKKSIGRIVRGVGPNWYQVVLDLFIEKNK
jgi:tRNA (guanine37-N1)-methyltransferase